MYKCRNPNHVERGGACWNKIVGAFKVLPVVPNFNISLVQLDENGTNCTNNPWTGLAYTCYWFYKCHQWELVQWNLFTVLINNFLINCIPIIVEGKWVSQNWDLMFPFLLSCLKLVVTSFTNDSHTLDRLQKRIPLVKTIDTNDMPVVP